MKTGCLLGAAIPNILRAVYKAVSAVLALIFKIIAYFGLYIPLLYLGYGGIMVLIFKIRLFDMSLYSSLYMIGLVLSVAAAVILTFRTGLGRFMRYREQKNVVEYRGARSRKAPEAPKIYKSKVNRGMIVYEYENRFDLYEQRGDRLIYAGTEYKRKRGRRW